MNDLWWTTDGIVWKKARATDMGARSANGMLTYGGHMFLFGGRNSSNTNLNDVWVY